MAVDIGGTKIAVAIVSGRSVIVARRTHATNAATGPEAVINGLFESMDGILEDTGIDTDRLSAVSVATAGVIDVRNGVVTTSPNLPGWNNVPLKQMLTDRYGVPAFLLNDADAAALGEHGLRTGGSRNTFILLTLGTGIGGGIIINDRLYLGASGSAAELGHMVVDVNGPACTCGRNGCLEALASGSSIAGEAAGRLRRGGRSDLTAMAGGRIENVTAEMVHAAARNGDELALAVIDRAAFYLGVGIANLVNIFNPGMVAIGGGMSAMDDLLITPIRKIVDESAFPLYASSVDIVTARLGSDAGLYGAAIFATGR